MVLCELVQIPHFYLFTEQAQFIVNWIEALFSEERFPEWIFDFIEGFVAIIFRSISASKFLVRDVLAFFNRYLVPAQQKFLETLLDNGFEQEVIFDFYAFEASTPFLGWNDLCIKNQKK